MAANGEQLSVAEVAATLKTTSLNVMMHIKRGLIKGEELDGSWYVSADSLAEYQRQTAGQANPQLCKSSCGHGCSTCN
ncbi:MAG TPA: hypothetical protein VIR78_13250 [Malonomonas sp.]